MSNTSSTWLPLDARKARKYFFFFFFATEYIAAPIKTRILILREENLVDTVYSLLLSPKLLYNLLSPL